MNGRRRKKKKEKPPANYNVYIRAKAETPDKDPMSRWRKAVRPTKTTTCAAIPDMYTYTYTILTRYAHVNNTLCTSV